MLRPRINRLIHTMPKTRNLLLFSHRFVHIVFNTIQFANFQKHLHDSRIRSTMQRAFAQKRLTPNIVLTAMDSDVIKTYVALGLGVGILAQMAFDPEQDAALRSIDASHLFEPSATHLGIRRNTYLRAYIYDFIEMFAPHLTRNAVDTAMKGGGSSYEL